MSHPSSSLDVLLARLTGMHNYSLLTVPAAWLICALPLVYAIKLTRGNYTQTDPKTYTALMQKKQNKTATDQKYLRAQAAHGNGMENLALYAVAMVLGNLSGLPASQLNTLGVGYLVSRALYNVFYIYSSNSLWWTRTIAFYTGMGIIFKLFYSSARVLQ